MMIENKYNKTAIIIGAGPAGLTAAYELLEKTANIKPIIYEISEDIGGIAKTINYKGNRMDMGGHRFFSKSDRIMQWWMDILPLQQTRSDNPVISIQYQNQNKVIPASHTGPDPEITDTVMLVRQRLSRILFLRKFFDYPISLNRKTITNLGLIRMLKIAKSYLFAKLFPIRNEKTLEDFFINRFGKELYLTFFKNYTEKVWGVACTEIDSEWGAQRVKGLSLYKTLLHIIKKIFSTSTSVQQKNIETSLIEEFLYPKFGPGQMWEKVAEIIQERGGEIHLNHTIIGMTYSGNTVTEVTIKDTATDQIKKQSGDYFFSTMPIKELITCLTPSVPSEVLHVASGLVYRDFITVGLLLKKLKIKNETTIETQNNLTPDNWIYIQEPEVKMGRLQIFNNWSPWLVKDPNTVWLGLEYFCNENDALWQKSDAEFMQFAIDELIKIDFIDKNQVLDHTLVRIKKAYPAYFGSYHQLEMIRKFTDNMENLFLIGRNGMHKYNNQDHSMLTAITAVENIIQGIKNKDNIWSVNTEQDYHETK